VKRLLNLRQSNERFGMNTPCLEGHTTPSSPQDFHFSFEDPEIAPRVLSLQRPNSALAWQLARGTALFEDLRQEGLVAICLAVRTFDEGLGTSFSTYGLQCARNRMLDCLRRERRFLDKTVSSDSPLRSDAEDPFIDSVPDNPAFPEIADNRYLIGQLHLAIARLPARERRCLELSFFEELKHEEIAVRLGVTRVRVGQLIDQAIGRLKQALVQ
jgi:RNA polymerase sigma factor (sigma-70 family)